MPLTSMPSFQCDSSVNLLPLMWASLIPNFLWLQSICYHLFQLHYPPPATIHVGFRCDSSVEHKIKFAFIDICLSHLQLLNMTMMVIMTMVRIGVGRWILTSGQCEGSAAAKAPMQCCIAAMQYNSIHCIHYNVT